MTNNSFPIFDGHNDTLLHLHSEERGGGRDFFVESDQGHIDLPRARRGSFAGGFFAIFVPSPIPHLDDENIMYTRDGNLKQTTDGYEVTMAPSVELAQAQSTTLAMMARLFRLERASEGQVKVVRTVDELHDCLQHNVLAAILHFEGAEAIDPQLDALEVFYQAGLRSLGLVWSRPNAFGYGVPFKYPSTPDTGPGLTDVGKALVQACNQLGILIDLAHLNEQGFWDVAKLSTKPLVSTHTCVHALSPTARNLTNKQLDAVRETQGMVGLNFCVNDLRADGDNNADTPLDTLLHHMDYLIEHVGPDCVGLGSDFDGAPIPQEIKDVTGLPKFLTVMREHGYDDALLRKLTHENWERVLRLTWTTQ
jgi:membrane dipeptidase